MHGILRSPAFDLAASAIATAAATALSFAWLGFVGILPAALFAGLPRCASDWGRRARSDRSAWRA